MDEKASPEGKAAEVPSQSERSRFVVPRSLLPEKRFSCESTEVDVQQKRQKQEGLTSALVHGTTSPKGTESGRLDFPLSDPPPLQPPATVTMSKVDKASTIQLSECLKKVTSSKGYRTARATHGVSEGCWYFEVQVEHLGETGHCRVGWATKQAHLYAPVGFDQYGYSYRDIEGTKQHKAERLPYGSPFGTGDVIGCLIHFPKQEKKDEEHKTELEKEGQSEEPKKEQPSKDAQNVPGSSIQFFKNGVWQSIAFQDLQRGTYFPAVSMFTRPDQEQGVTLRLEFGPQFMYPPSEISEMATTPQPMCRAAEGQATRGPIISPKV